MELYLTAVFFLVGLCGGSFVNMLLYRTEVRYKIQKKKVKSKNESRSFCDFCGEQLRWFENIPVASWVILKGRSRCCNKRLPRLYPTVEMTVGVLFAYIIYHLSFIIDWNLPIYLIIVSLLVFSAVFDWKYMILPDFSTYILIGCAGLLWFLNNFGDYNFIFAGLGAFLFLLILHLATKGQGMGMGDVKYVFFMGLLLGLTRTVLAFYLAFVVGALVGLVLIIFYKKNKKSRIPFGPYLIMATLVGWFWGEGILLYLYKWF
ncbi:prepilin peptidase [Candidatus Shapirobacteria bacterium]|nr:prepilin peptidase [Candidatus Shapirobacteria bacterium]